MENKDDWPTIFIYFPLCFGNVQLKERGKKLSIICKYTINLKNIKS